MGVIGQTTKVSLERACEIILDSTRHIGHEQAGIINAYGRTLAQTIESSIDVPNCDTAAKDGYAALSQDTCGASEKNPRSLSVLAESTLSSKKQLEPGTVIRVRAGHPLPKGADTVIEQGNLYRPSGGPEVLVFNEIKPGTNVQPVGMLIG